MAKNLFFKGEHAVDRVYRRILQGEEPRLRERLEEIWREFSPYADSQFAVELGRQFEKRIWELHLGGALLRAGFKLIAVQSPSPDIALDIHGHRVWVEAIAPGPGDPHSKDRVPDPPRDKIYVITETMEEKVVLRLTGAVAAKFDDKLNFYREKGIVGPRDSYVIAINTSQIELALTPETPPYIVQALFPIGREQIDYDMESGALVEQYRLLREDISKAKGTRIPTTIFIDQRYSPLTAVLASHANVYSLGSATFDDFVAVLNPLANVRIPDEFVRVIPTVWEASPTMFNLSLRGSTRAEKPINVREKNPT